MTPSESDSAMSGGAADNFEQRGEAREQASVRNRLEELAQQALASSDRSRTLVVALARAADINIDERPPPAPPTPAEFAQALIADRRRRETLFNPLLFADPAWDLLLDLFVAAERGQQVSITSACHAVPIPHATALRWVAAMVARGVFDRTGDPADARRSFVNLTPEAHAKMTRYIRETAEGCGVILSRG